MFTWSWETRAPQSFKMSFKGKKLVGELPPEELAKIAKEVLNEDPARTKADIKHIQEWIKKQPHLNKSINMSK